MNHPKTEPKVKKPASQPRARREPAPAAAPARQSNPPAALIEACDRLGQKLDEFAGAIREQIEASRQIHPPHAPRHVLPVEPTRHPASEPVPGERAVSENPPAAPPESGAEPAPAQPGIAPASEAIPSAQPIPSPAAANPVEPPPARPAAQPEAKAMPAFADPSNDIFDKLAQAAGAWQEQAEASRRALDAIMDYLENQPLPPKVDLDGILSRLRGLEERQQNPQSQVNNSRWGT